MFRDLFFLKNNELYSILNFDRQLFFVLAFCFFSPLLFAATLDTLPIFPTMKLGNKWIELGIGSSSGSFFKRRHFGRNGPEPVNEKIKNRSINFDGSYNWGLRRGRVGIGIKSAFGSVIFTEKIDQYNGFNFSAIGIYGVIEGKWLGFKYGRFYINHLMDQSDTYRANHLLILNARLGKIRSYYIDLAINDGIGMGLFPEPFFSFGFFNFGFNDQSGMRKIRLALSAIEEANQTPMVTIGFQHPISEAPLLFAGNMHLGKQKLLCSMGIRYRFDRSYK